MPKLFPSLVLASLAICGCRSADTGRVDARLAAFIPADTVMLAGARMDEIRSVAQTGDANDSAAQAERLRKMLLAMVDDIRVVLIKLAERTQALRFLMSGDANLR